MLIPISSIVILDLGIIILDVDMLILISEITILNLGNMIFDQGITIPRSRNGVQCSRQGHSVAHVQNKDLRILTKFGGLMRR
jgi:hypothetical protein